MNVVVMDYRTGRCIYVGECSDDGLGKKIIKGRNISET